MGVASGLVTLVDETTIEVADLNLNFTTLTSSVNNIVSAQITDGAILNADINASAEIAMSKITATASDATLSAVLGNFLDGCWVYRVDDDTIGVTIGSAMINGELRKITSGGTNDPSMTASKWNDIYLVADTAASTFTLEVQTNLANPGAGTASGTNTRLIGSFFTDSDGDIQMVINYRPDKVIGWNYLVGDGTQDINSTDDGPEGDVVFGVTFDFDPLVKVSYLQIKGAAAVPVDTGDFPNAAGIAIVVGSKSIITTGCVINMATEAGEATTSGDYYGYIWEAEGRYS